MLSLAALYMGPYGPGGGPGPWALAGPIWLLLWFFAIGAVVFLFFGRARRGRWMRGGPWGPGGPRRPWGPGGPGHPWGGPPDGPDGEGVKPADSPELALERARAILHERYARGEISTEEYRERIDNLV